MDIMSLILVVLVVGLIIILVLSYLSFNRAKESLLLEVKEAAMAKTRVESHLETITGLKQELDEKNQSIARLITEKTQAETRYKTLAEQSIVTREQLDLQQKSFKEQFANLAHEILNQQTEQIKKFSKSELESMLHPFRENIDSFKKRVEAIYADENTQRGALKNELENLMKLNKKITEETSNITNALKGNSKTQGDWGEMILETILDGSSLINGIHYFIQESIKDENGREQRPDVIVALPESKRIVIDSKVSVSAFIDYCNAESAQEKEIYLAKHLESVKRHIRQLSDKNYQKLVDSPDFVIMFIPNEPAFLSALQAESDIWAQAYQKNIILSSPTNLFALLKIVADIWNRDQQNKNALEIASQGGALYDKFILFAETFLEVGRKIEDTSSAYEKAMGQLKTGRGNLVSRVERIKKLKVNTLKTLPDKLSDFEQEEELTES